MSGHHGVWLRWIVRGLRKDGNIVTVATLATSRQHPIVAEIEAEADVNVRLLYFPWRSRDAKLSKLFRLSINEIRYWRLYRTMFIKARRSAFIDAVFLPYLDYCTNAISLFGSPFSDTPWSAVIMRPAFHHRAIKASVKSRCLDAVKELLFFRLLLHRTLLAVFALDELLVVYVGEKSEQRAKRLEYLADPVEISRTVTKEEARKLYRIPDEAFVVLVYGALSLRKGIDTLLEAIKSERIPKKLHLLLVGEQDHDVKTLLGAVNPLIGQRIHQFDSYVSAEEEYAAFMSADYVWMGYRNHLQMSAVLVQAGKIGVPIIACADGLIGKLTQKYGNGVVLPARDNSSVVKTLLDIIDSPDKVSGFMENGKRAYEKHDVDNAVASIIRVLRSQSVDRDLHCNSASS